MQSALSDLLSLTHSSILSSHLHRCISSETLLQVSPPQSGINIYFFSLTRATCSHQPWVDVLRLATQTDRFSVYLAAWLELLISQRYSRIWLQRLTWMSTNFDQDSLQRKTFSNVWELVTVTSWIDYSHQWDWLQLPAGLVAVTSGNVYSHQRDCAANMWEAGVLQSEFLVQQNVIN